MSTETTPPTWEKETVEKILLESIHEQRRSRRWKIFFRIVYLLIIILLVIALMPDHSKDYYNKTKKHTAVVNVKGELLDEGEANSEDINAALDDAFEDPNTQAVMLQINSPGGSPVQAGEVYQHMHYLQKQHPKIKVYAVCTDMCASGAYYIAAGADYIYADQASLVGSIGVLMNGFGFVDTLQKVGVTRRLMTAGSEKGFLDPFSPLKPEDEQYMQTMLETIHQQFITAVKQGRGNRLSNDPMLFTGLVWTGEQAKPLGLIDGIASPEQVARDIIKNDTLVNYGSTPSLLQKFSKHVGASAASSAASLLGVRRSLLN